MRFNLIALFLILSMAEVFAQKDLDESAEWSIRDRGYVGIGLGGLGFGNSGGVNYFTIGLSGQLGYMLTKNLSSGLGTEFQYYSFSGSQSTKSSYTTYTWYPFVRYNIKDYFIQADYDYYSTPTLSNIKERIIINRFFVGVGYSSPLQNGGRFNFLVSYDFLYPNNNAITSPLSTRFYFTF